MTVLLDNCIVFSAYDKHNVLLYLELPLRKTDLSPNWMCAFIYGNDTTHIHNLRICTKPEVQKFGKRCPNEINKNSGTN
ncbi:unnamed protein product [Macrosiphum euphorbiae]|uniref:LAGLIDADG homing endonuclease n=1 Tax=Macrosiphum euphorbiae TaxID=13131 RepID=A0AAV0VTY3_9HEMI|nr:unnamed protein product [Macrosiphum euphorbiae]